MCRLKSAIVVSGDVPKPCSVLIVDDVEDRDQLFLHPVGRVKATRVSPVCLSRRSYEDVLLVRCVVFAFVGGWAVHLVHPINDQRRVVTKAIRILHGANFQGDRGQDLLRSWNGLISPYEQVVKGKDRTCPIGRPICDHGVMRPGLLFPRVLACPGCRFAVLRIPKPCLYARPLPVRTGQFVAWVGSRVRPLRAISFYLW